MLAGYDDDPVEALSVALRRVLDLPDATWPQLLAAAALAPARRGELLRQREAALDALARELNEERTLPGPRP